jgi:hypothetical protein
MILECEQQVLTDHFPCLLGKGKSKFNTLTKSGGQSSGCKDMGELKVLKSKMLVRSGQREWIQISICGSLQTLNR